MYKINRRGCWPTEACGTNKGWIMWLCQWSRIQPYNTASSAEVVPRFEPPPPMQSCEISTWTKSFPDISHLVSPVTVTTNGKQLPIAVNVNANFTLIPFIHLHSCTWYNAFILRFIIDDFVARSSFGCPSQVRSNLYFVVSSVETINSGRSGNTDVPKASETPVQ